MILWVLKFSIFNRLQVLPDGFAQTHVEGIADDGMSDAHLVGPWYHLMIVVEVDKTEVMTCIKSEALSACLFCRLDEGGDGNLAVDKIVGGVGFGV